MYAELMQKTCTKCLLPKDISLFYKSKRYADGHVTWCKSCKQEHARNNPHIIQQWVDNNKDISVAIKQKYVENNRTKVRSSKAKWSKANNKKVLAATRRYQLAKLKRTPKWLTTEDIKQIELFYINCPEGYHVDHIIPLRGKNISGFHVLSNLQYLPAGVNQRKSNKY